MDVSFIIVAVACNDPDFKLPNGAQAKVGKCESCDTMVWLHLQALKLKKNKPNHQVWCKGCVEKEQDKSDTHVQFLNIDDAANFDAADDIDEFQKKLAEVEEKYFARAKHGHSQTMASLRESLPSLVRCAMSRLKIWNSIEDLMLALMLRTLVEEILLRQRDTLGDLVGPEATFQGYDRPDISAILSFIFGTSKALDEVKEKLDKHGFDSLYDEDTIDRWRSGMDHWSDGFHGDSWGGGEEGEDWNL